MATFLSLAAFGQMSPSDLGRCGLPYNYMPSSVPAEEAAALAGARLVACADAGDAAQAARCLVDGADRDFQDSYSGETALHRAAQRGKCSVLEMLLIAGADPHRTDCAQRTPLYMAANAGCLPAVQTLLSHGAQLFPFDTASSPPTPACPCASSLSSSSPQQHQPWLYPQRIQPQEAQHPHQPQNQPQQPQHLQTVAALPLPNEEEDDAAFLALRATCPLAAAAAAARWPVVAALLGALPSSFARYPAALRSLRFLVWALASHKAFPREVISRLPRRLPPCVLNAVRPATLASTPLVLAAGNDQQQLMQWLLQQGADPELGAPLLLCAGRFCHGSRTCCVNTLLRRGAAPHVAWADNPADSPLQLAARGDCFTHVHCLVAYGADVGGQAGLVRTSLYSPAPWEAHLDALLAANRELLSAALTSGADATILCPCGLQHASWPGLWPLDGEPEAETDVEAEGTGGVEGGSLGRGRAAREGGEVGNSCQNRTPSDDAWYRHHRLQMEQLQDGEELSDCRKAVDELWAYGCSAVTAELGGPPALGAPHSLLPSAVLAALRDVAGGWLAAAARCRQQRLLRQELYDKAVAAGRRLLERKRVAALAALGGAGLRGGGGAAVTTEDGEAVVVCGGGTAAAEGLAAELRMEILALAGLAPPGMEAGWLASPRGRSACGCEGCSG